MWLIIAQPCSARAEDMLPSNQENTRYPASTAWFICVSVCALMINTLLIAWLCATKRPLVADAGSQKKMLNHWQWEVTGSGSCKYSCILWRMLPSACWEKHRRHHCACHLRHECDCFQSFECNPSPFSSHPNLCPLTFDSWCPTRISTPTFEISHPWLSCKRSINEAGPRRCDWSSSGENV